MCNGLTYAQSTYRRKEALVSILIVSAEQCKRSAVSTLTAGSKRQNTLLYTENISKYVSGGIQGLFLTGTLWSARDGTTAVAGLIFNRSNGGGWRQKVYQVLRVLLRHFSSVGLRSRNKTLTSCVLLSGPKSQNQVTRQFAVRAPLLGTDSSARTSIRAAV